MEAKRRILCYIDTDCLEGSQQVNDVWTNQKENTKEQFLDESHCAANIILATWGWNVHIYDSIFREVSDKGKGKPVNNVKTQNPRNEMNGKKVIEVQPSPSPEN